MIITDKNKLTETCEDTNIFEAADIVKKLEEVLGQEQSGVGLAANQIGINKKVCIIKTKRYDINLANPVILDQKGLSIFRNEGCLSFPGQYLITQRYNEIYLCDLFHPNGIVCYGLMAAIVQHEVGHLWGKTMYDYSIKLPKPNDLCFCGSGLKFKKCHSGVEIK